MSTRSFESLEPFPAVGRERSRHRCSRGRGDDVGFRAESHHHMRRSGSGFGGFNRRFFLGLRRRTGDGRKRARGPEKQIEAESRYGFGIYIGIDGKEHLGIDRMYRPGSSDMMVVTSGQTK